MQLGLVWVSVGFLGGINGQRAEGFALSDVGDQQHKGSKALSVSSLVRKHPSIGCFPRLVSLISFSYSALTPEQH